MKPPRVIKPNPADPDWKFPYASRQYMGQIARYMAQCGSRNTSWTRDKRNKSVLPESRKNRIPWESVPPHFRHRTQQLFNRKVAIEKAKKIPGWPSPGKINSIRMNCANAGRHFFNGESYTRYQIYKSYKKMWLLYQDWLAQEERAKLLAARGPEAHAQLDIE